jgi:penicillin-binding protein 1A
VGFDEPRQIIRNGYGATLALPIWAEFMKHSFAKASVNEFSIPPGIEKVTICAKSGLLATGACGANVYSDYFPLGSIPQFACYMHDGMTDPSRSDSTAISTDLAPAPAPAGEPSETTRSDRVGRVAVRGSVVFRN